MTEVTFRKTQNGKLEGKPFPQAGDTVEVSDAMLPGLRFLGFIEDGTPAPDSETADARETREVAPEEAWDFDGGTEAPVSAANAPEGDQDAPKGKGSGKGHAGKSED